MDKAYNFAMFEESKAVEETPKLSVVKKTKTKKAYRTKLIKRILVWSLIAFVSILTLTLKVQYTELNDQVLKAEEELRILESEATRLSLYIESNVSLRVVEEVAQYELGLVKAESHQTHFVDFGESDTVVVSGNDISVLGQLEKSISSIYDRARAYLGY